MRRRIVNIEDSSLTTVGRVMFCNRPNAGLDRFLLRSSRFDQLRDVQLLQSLRGDGGAAGTRRRISQQRRLLVDFGFVAE
jgi:hypothetical protein